MRPSALFTDRYELAMAQAYAAAGQDAEAVFEVFFRQLPPGYNFLLAGGLEPALDALEAFRFEAADLEYLRREEVVAPEFLDVLAGLRFTGQVHAVAEGTVVFPHEPLVQVVAPVAEAQLVETVVLNHVHCHTTMASSAARHVLAAAGRPVVDFGARRCPGPEAAHALARASFIAGAAGTSNLLAGRRLGIPTLGTMAHSYVQVHDDEKTAFARFAAEFPETTLLVDTYDTMTGVERVIELADDLGDRFAVRAVRIDSGDLADLARRARARLDAAGLAHLGIILSGGLDEHRIAELVAGGVPVNGFGVGARLGLSPAVIDLDLAYKLVAYDGEPRLKTSRGKEILPGRKQVYRRERGDHLAGDVIAPWDAGADGRPLLQAVMTDGRRVPGARPTLQEIREHAARQVDQLPAAFRTMTAAPEPYPVTVDPRLARMRDARRAAR